MAEKYATYDNEGRIINVYSLNSGEAIKSKWPDAAGVAYIGDDFNGATHYLPNGVKTPRPVWPVVVQNVTGDYRSNVITGLPKNCQVIVMGESISGKERYGASMYRADGTQFRFTATKDGNYTFMFDPPFPYIPMRIKISQSFQT